MLRERLLPLASSDSVGNKVFRTRLIRNFRRSRIRTNQEGWSNVQAIEEAISGQTLSATDIQRFQEEGFIVMPIVLSSPEIEEVELAMQVMQSAKQRPISGDLSVAVATQGNSPQPHTKNGLSLTLKAPYGRSNRSFLSILKSWKFLNYALGVHVIKL